MSILCFCLKTCLETKLDGDNLLRSGERKVDETLEKLEALYAELLKLKALWTEWEDQVWQLEELAREGLETQANTLHDQGATLTALERTADTMSPMMSVSARLATHHRLEQLRQKMKQLSKVGHVPRGSWARILIFPSVLFHRSFLHVCSPRQIFAGRRNTRLCTKVIIIS